MSTAANRECVTVGEGERDFWEGVGLKKGEEWGKLRKLNQDAGAS